MPSDLRKQARKPSFNPVSLKLSFRNCSGPAPRSKIRRSRAPEAGPLSCTFEPQATPRSPGPQGALPQSSRKLGGGHMPWAVGSWRWEPAGGGLDMGQGPSTALWAPEPGCWVPGAGLLSPAAGCLGAWTWAQGAWGVGAGLWGLLGLPAGTWGVGGGRWVLGAWFGAGDRAGGLLGRFLGAGWLELGGWSWVLGAGWLELGGWSFPGIHWSKDPDFVLIP